MLIVLSIIAVLNLAGLVFLARALGSIALAVDSVQEDVTYLEDRVINRINALAKLNANFHEMNLSTHRVTRRYIGSELILGKLFPALGVVDPIRTPQEVEMINQIGAEMEAAAQEQSNF